LGSWGKKTKLKPGNDNRKKKGKKKVEKKKKKGDYSGVSLPCHWSTLVLCGTRKTQGGKGQKRRKEIWTGKKQWEKSRRVSRKGGAESARGLAGDHLPHAGIGGETGLDEKKRRKMVQTNQKKRETQRHKVVLQEKLGGGVFTEAASCSRTKGSRRGKLPGGTGKNKWGGRKGAHKGRKTEGKK